MIMNKKRQKKIIGMKGVDAMREDAAFLKSVNKFAFSITIFIDF